MKPCKLTKLTSTHNNLRTDVVEGMGSSLEVGLPFLLEADPLEYGDKRYITTSPVTEVTQTDTDTYEFETMNSTYRLEYLK